jgi:DNA-binding XRE family transcriptional regulator
MDKEEFIEIQKELGVMNKDLAKDLGVSVRTISYYKNGRFEPSEDIVKILLVKLALKRISEKESKKQNISLKNT